MLEVVPATLRAEVAKAMPSKPQSRPLGPTKTYGRLAARYHVHRYNPKQDTTNGGPLKALPPPAEPSHIVGVDATPFDSMRRGNKVVVIATEHLMTCPVGDLPGGLAEGEAKFLVAKVALAHKAPMTLLSDRGQCFTARLLVEAGKPWDFQHGETMACYPCDNRLIGTSP